MTETSNKSLTAGETPAATRRSRVFGWDDPAISAGAVPHHSGLDFLREILAGRLPAPPIAATLGFTLEEAEYGRAVFVLVPGEEHYNPIGSVHGGVYATLLDSAAGCAVQSVLPQGMGYTSIDLTLKFLRPITVDTGKVHAIGTVLNSGRRTALAQAELRDSDDRLLAHATSSCMLFPVPTR
ncbi:PaaI family thioesterase [Streptomyces echinatus]|uniref:PaaI family thioesterase n=1 Tax=Streptomyces echinatus TaxID=67293 RepID=UPI0037B0B846